MVYHVGLTGYLINSKGFILCDSSERDMLSFSFFSSLSSLFVRSTEKVYLFFPFGKLRVDLWSFDQMAFFSHKLGVEGKATGLTSCRV